MRRNGLPWLLLHGALSWALATSVAVAGPLAAFEDFAGTWTSENGEWRWELRQGLDERMLLDRRWRNGELVREGAWFWNPLKQQAEERLVAVNSTVPFIAGAAVTIEDGVQIDRVGATSHDGRWVTRTTWTWDEGVLVETQHALPIDEEAPALVTRWHRETTR